MRIYSMNIVGVTKTSRTYSMNIVGVTKTQDI